MEKYRKDLNPKKSATFNNIPPTKYLKENSDICGNIITQLINDCIKDCDFPNNLKLADLTPIHLPNGLVIRLNILRCHPTLF